MRGRPFVLKFLAACLFSALAAAGGCCFSGTEARDRGKVRSSTRCHSPRLFRSSWREPMWLPPSLSLSSHSRSAMSVRRRTKRAVLLLPPLGLYSSLSSTIATTALRSSVRRRRAALRATCVARCGNVGRFAPASRDGKRRNSCGGLTKIQLTRHARSPGWVLPRAPWRLSRTPPSASSA